MRLNRRTLISTAACAAGALVLPRRAVAELAIGGGTVTTVSDGTLALPLALPSDVPDEELSRLLAEFGLEDGAAPPRPLNVTLWRGGDRTVLIDAGSGPGFVPTAGELLANLDAIGVAPEDVTDVVFTHAHPDHIWGVLDDFDEIAFPEAALYLAENERAFWTDPATIDALPADRQSFAIGAARRIEAMAGRLSTFEGGDEVVPGLTAVATPGHTPGHSSFLIDAGGERAMILGDVVTNAHLDFARPAWPSGADHDPELAGATRAAVLGELAGSGTAIVGYHLPGSGIGHVVNAETGYRFAEGTP